MIFFKLCKYKLVKYHFPEVAAYVHKLGLIVSSLSPEDQLRSFVASCASICFLLLFLLSSFMSPLATLRLLIFAQCSNHSEHHKTSYFALFLYFVYFFFSPFFSPSLPHIQAVCSTSLRFFFNLKFISLIFSHFALDLFFPLPLFFPLFLL